MKYYFRAEKMSVGYQKHPLIENIEIALQKGEILTLIGPNGAGKSTILKSIARELALICGTVYIDEKQMETMSGQELSKNLAVVFTEKLRSEMMTCEDVVATGRYPYTGRFGILSPKDHQVVKEAMESVHVTAIKDQDFNRISDGQRQRVMLARAIAQEPEIIILDEPTSYLDIRYKLEFLSVLQEMRKKKGLTVIMSLHELELAEKVSDKILCVNGRYVDRFGKPEEIFVPGYIAELFSLSSGSYDEINGNMELPAIKGDAEVFVIAGNGTGSFLFRQLQRNGIPFAVGILGKNDLDYPAAEALAVQVIAAEAYQDFERQHYEAAKQVMCACRKVICCQTVFGSQNVLNRQLLQEAEDCGMEIELWQK